MANIDKKIPKDDPQYKFALKLINKILINASKLEIQNILEFKDITRDDIVTQKNLEELNNLENELLELFKKSQIGYYRKNEAKGYVINCLRGIIKSLGYKIVLLKKDRTLDINGGRYRKTFLIYHIE